MQVHIDPGETEQAEGTFSGRRHGRNVAAKSATGKPAGSGGMRSEVADTRAAAAEVFPGADLAGRATDAPTTSG